MPDQGKSATGPVILERVIQLEAKIDTLTERIDEALAAVERRYKLIDQFIDPSMNLQGTLSQIIASQQRLKTAVENAERAVRDEHTTTRSAVALHMGAGDLARERNS